MQTLDFTPYRVDLTPFAGALSDGQPHTIAVSVFNANNFFATTASLLLFLDHRATRVTGAVTVDTLAAAPSPTVTPAITTAADGAISGTVNVEANRRFRIVGFANTSHGRVTTEVTGDLRFANRQRFDITATLYRQRIAQTTSVLTRTSTEERGRRNERLLQMS